MTKPTIRELLTDFDITDLKHEQLAERVEAVLKIHRIGKTRCVADGLEYPCATIRALDGER